MDKATPGWSLGTGRAGSQVSVWEDVILSKMEQQRGEKQSESALDLELDSALGAYL